MADYIPVELRRLIADRAGFSCEYCRAQMAFSGDTFTADHIVPQSLAGPTSSENLAFCCHSCNQHKAARLQALDPSTNESAFLFHPRQQLWDEHFAWNEDFTRILGLTPTGRATIAALHLNRSGLLNLRRVLFAINEHPPRAARR